MFKYFSKCIFCLSPLPPNSSGDGEHVIPKNIYGFWRVYDVCDKCREHFGKHVDQLAIKNPWIIKALKELNLPEFETYSENLPFIGKDTIAGYSIKMIRRNKGFKNKVRQEENQFLECSEDDWEKFGIKWIIDGLVKKLPKELIDKEIEKLKVNYKKISPGESVKSSLFDIEIRKRQTKDVDLDYEQLPTITPLIAKIAVVFLVFFLPPRIISTLFDIDTLVKHAIKNEPIRKYLINWCTLIPQEEYVKIHAIRMHSVGNSITLDISLFGYPNWRIIVDSNQKIIMDSINGFQFDNLLFIMDFRNPELKQKVLGIKPLDSNDYHYYEISV